MNILYIKIHNLLCVQMTFLYFLFPFWNISKNMKIWSIICIWWSLIHQVSRDKTNKCWWSWLLAGYKNQLAHLDCPVSVMLMLASFKLQANLILFCCCCDLTLSNLCLLLSHFILSYWVSVQQLDERRLQQLRGWSAGAGETRGMSVNQTEGGCAEAGWWCWCG